MNNMTDMGEQIDAKLLLSTLMALKKGDFTARMPSDWTGMAGKIADTQRNHRNQGKNGAGGDGREPRGGPRRPPDAARAGAQYVRRLGRHRQRRQRADRRPG